LTIDFLGKIDDVAFEGGAGTDVPVDIGGDGFIPGFAEQLVGAKPGDTRVIKVTFPADYGKADVAGKPATFEITVKQLNRQIIPVLDDELAKKLGAESLTGIREVVTSRQQQEYDQMSRVRLKKDLLDALTVTASFQVPPSMVEDEFKQIWSQLEQARKAGTEDAEDKGKDDETLTAEYRPIAERRVRLGLLLAEIARLNSITVTDQELDRAFYSRAMQFPGQEMQMLELYRKYPQFGNSVRGPLMEDKVVDFVLELANVTDRVVPPEELAKELDSATDTAAA
jgi:trigger factor